MEFFRQAAAKDPTYAAAYAGLADGYSLLGRGPYDALPPHQAMAEARRLATKAIELDDSLAEAYTSLAFVKFAYEWNFTEAERLFRRALDLNPGYVTAHQWYSQFLMAAGRLDEALASMKRAQELEPLSPVIGAGLARCYYYLGQFDKAAEAYRNVLEMNSDYFVAHFGLGWVLVELRKYPQAVEEFKKAETLSGGSMLAPLATRGYAHAIAGSPAEARAVLKQLAALGSKRYVPSFYAAGIHAELGEQEEAYRFGKAAFDERCEYLVYAHRDPKLAKLLAEPRIGALMREHGLAR